MPGQWRQGLTRTEREQGRATLADWLSGHGYDEDHEMRRLGSPACATGSCSSCDAEMSGGAGCPHECHDARADEVAAMTERWRAGLANRG